MRVKYIIPFNQHLDCINHKMYELICHELKTRDYVDVVDSNPDIVHVFGMWNAHNASCVEKYRSIGVPVVFTCVEGLAPLIDAEGYPTKDMSTRHALKRISKLKTVVHVCGTAEESLIKQIAKNTYTRQIKNPYVTSLTTVQLMSEAICNLYVSEIQANEARIKRDIDQYIEHMGSDDKCINNVCARILYIRKRYKMQNIPYAYLTETAETMTQTNYDEDLMRTTLEKMKLSKFAAHTMSLLRNKANLTEGFMPLASLEGKEVERMENVTIQQH